MANIIEQDLSSPDSTADMREQRRVECMRRLRNRQDSRAIDRRNMEELHSHFDALEIIENVQTNLQFQDILKGITSSNSRRQTEGIIELRKMLTGDIDNSLVRMLANNLIPILLKWLRNFGNEHLQSVAAWAVSRLAITSQPLLKCILNYNMVPCLINLLYADAANVIDHGVMALSAIAGRSAAARDIIVSQNVMKSILYLARNPTLEFFLYDFVCLILKLCSHTNEPIGLHHVKPLLPYLSELLSISDQQVVYVSCCTLWYITKEEEANAKALLDTTAISNLVDLLECQDNTLLDIALRTMGNIIVYGDEIADIFINSDGLTKLKVLLKSPQKEIAEESAWIISNITIGSYNQIKAVLDADLFPCVETILKNGHFQLQVEAAWILSNAFGSDYSALIMQIINKYTLLEPFCALLDITNREVIKVVLSGMWGLLSKLEKPEETMYYCKKIDNAGGLEKILNLHGYQNDQMYKVIIWTFNKFYMETKVESTTTHQKQE